MTSRSTRSIGKHKVPAHSTQDLLAIQNFKLPDNMSFSNIKFPVLIKPEMRRCTWKTIEAEHGRKLQTLQDFVDKRERELNTREPVFINTETDYIRDNVLIFLLPVLEKTLESARLWNVFEEPNSLFNGVDHIAQLLWNTNPRYPKRKVANLYIFNMPWVKEHLKTNPRPFLPKSWLWTKNYAATIIQKSYRRYRTQLKPDVKEMREFWNKIQIEDNFTKEMSSNPLLMKKFAAQQVKFASITSVAKKVDKKPLRKTSKNKD